MLIYLMRRVLAAIPTILIAIIGLFFVVRLMPGDAASVKGGADASAEDIARLREQLGLDKSPFTALWDYLTALLRGDMGLSLATRLPVADEVFRRLEFTLTLAAMAIVFALVVGALLGILASIYNRTVIDSVVSMLAAIGLAMPSYWAALLLMLFFSVQLGWVPTSGTQGTGWWILPVATIAMYPLGMVARITRAAHLEISSKDYVRTAFAKGAGSFRVVLRHSLRNSLPTVLTVFGLQFGSLIAGSVMAEFVFSLPGIGSLLVDSLLRRDTPMILGAIIVIAVVLVLVNIVIDVIQAIADPRVRYQ